MISNDLRESLDRLGEESGIKKVYLYDHSGEFICEDSKNNFTGHGRSYCSEQIQNLLNISNDFRIYNEEIVYDLDDSRVSILFLDHALLVIFMDTNADQTSLQIAQTSLGRTVNNLMARASSAQNQNEQKKPKTKPKIQFASRSSSIDKESLPDVIEADSSFIIYLKKLITHYAGAKAARELNSYLHEKRIHVETLDSLTAYNLIEGLAIHLEIDNKDDFKVDAQQVLNRYF